MIWSGLEMLRITILCWTIDGVAIAMKQWLNFECVHSDCSLSFHVLLYFPLRETTIILNESLVYEWKIQQHMRRQPKFFIWNAVGNIGDRVSHMLWNVNLKCYKMFRNVTRNVVHCRNMGIQNVMWCDVRWCDVM